MIATLNKVVIRLMLEYNFRFILISLPAVMVAVKATSQQRFYHNFKRFSTLFNKVFHNSYNFSFQLYL